MNRILHTVAGIALVLAACSDAPRSAGPDAEPRHGVVDLRIGVADGEAPYVFGRVTGIAEDAEGRIFVADFAAHEIRVFDGTGQFQFIIGREGSGPGELRGPCCLAFAPDGVLWVRDGGNGRYVGFRINANSADAVATLRMAHSDVWRQAPLGFTADGGFIDTGTRFTPTGGDELHRFLLTASGEVVGSVPIAQPTPAELGTVVKGDQMNMMFFPQPFGPTFLLAFGPNGVWASAVSSGFHVTAHMADSTLFTITGDVATGPPLSESDITQAEERIDAYIRMGGGTRSDYPQIPATKPPLAALMYDQAGRLWAAFNTAETDDAHANLYDAQGTLVERRAWPRDVSLAFPAWLGADHAIGIAADSLGVQRIVRVVWR